MRYKIKYILVSKYSTVRSIHSSTDRAYSSVLAYICVASLIRLLSFFLLSPIQSSIYYYILGTPYYVAPEVLRREYTEACDIWSIGVITYILLCGYPPFYGDSDAEIFNSVRTGEFDFPSPEWDEISNSAKDFVTFLLQHAEEMRPTAIEAMEHPWITIHVPSSIASSLSSTNNSNNNNNNNHDNNPAVVIPNNDDNNTTRKKIMSNQSVRGTTFQKYLGMQKLKKAALVTIAQNLTHEEVGSLEAIFRQVDQAGDGVMSLTELHDAIVRGT